MPVFVSNKCMLYSQKMLIIYVQFILKSCWRNIFPFSFVQGNEFLTGLHFEFRRMSADEISQPIFCSE